MTKRADALVKGDVLITGGPVARPGRVALVHRWAYGVIIQTDEGAWLSLDDARSILVA